MLQVLELRVGTTMLLVGLVQAGTTQIQQQITGMFKFWESNFGVRLLSRLWILVNRYWKLLQVEHCQWQSVLPLAVVVLLQVINFKLGRRVLRLRWIPLSVSFTASRRIVLLLLLLLLRERSERSEIFVNQCSSPHWIP